MINLRPIINPTITEFIQNEAIIDTFCDPYESYVNVLFPENMNRNIESFKSIFSKNHIRGKIWYAHKSNKSQCLVAQAESQDICIDVASVYELKNALNNGFTGQRIEITGPKSRELIFLGLKHDVLFNIDNINELLNVLSISKAIQKKEKIKILLRFSGFKSENIKYIKKDSKFGIPFEKYAEIFEILNIHTEKINLLGFSFHIDSTEINEKVLAVENCLMLFDSARDFGFDPYVLNIGGGFKQNYLKYQEDWDTCISALKEVQLGKRDSFVWGNQGFGLYNDKGTLRGALSIYNSYNKITGCEYLDELLSKALPSFDNRQIGTILSENMIELYIEPGRSLLDQTGVTIAKIIEVKESTMGEFIAVLNMRRTNVVFGDTEIFMDPVIIRRDGKKRYENGNYGIFLAGNLCLESDFICKRKIYLDTLPKKGDIVIFVNTASYLMDFNTSEFRYEDLKFAVTKKENKFKWYKDGNYNPIFQN